MNCFTGCTRAAPLPLAVVSKKWWPWQRNELVPLWMNDGVTVPQLYRYRLPLSPLYLTVTLTLAAKVS